MALKRGKEIPTIDCVLITAGPITTGGDEIGLKTASQIAVEVQSQATEAVTLIIKGSLIAQKPEESTITGNQITLTDNVFNPELVLMLQGGSITKDEEGNITGYTPPVAGSPDKGEIFPLNAYSAIYNAAGIVTGYEKITYPNCQGMPINLSSEDNVFRVNEYVINSMPNTGEPPYTITYIGPDELPVLPEYVPTPSA